MARSRDDAPRRMVEAVLCFPARNGRPPSGCQKYSPLTRRLIQIPHARRPAAVRDRGRSVATCRLAGLEPEVCGGRSTTAVLSVLFNVCAARLFPNPGPAILLRRREDRCPLRPPRGNRCVMRRIDGRLPDGRLPLGVIVWAMRGGGVVACLPACSPPYCPLSHLRHARARERGRSRSADVSLSRWCGRPLLLCRSLVALWNRAATQVQRLSCLSPDFLRAAVQSATRELSAGPCATVALGPLRQTATRDVVSGFQSGAGFGGCHGGTRSKLAPETKRASFSPPTLGGAEGWGDFDNPGVLSPASWGKADDDFFFGQVGNVVSSVPPGVCLSPSQQTPMKTHTRTPRIKTSGQNPTKMT
jgi:hypothetical protein